MRPISVTISKEIKEGVKGRLNVRDPHGNNNVGGPKADLRFDRRRSNHTAEILGNSDNPIGALSHRLPGRSPLSMKCGPHW